MDAIGLQQPLQMSRGVAVIKGTKNALKILAWPETYAHVKENEEA